MTELVRVEGVAVEPILDATFDIWHEGLGRPAYSKYWAAQLATPWGRAHLTRYALVDGGDVRASAKLYEFDARLDGRAIRIAGLGAVFTMPGHRRRGAGREIVDRVIALATANGADAALLFSEIGPGYYARLGFEAIPVCDLTLRVIEDARRGAPATMVRAGHDRDFADVVAMDAVRAEPFRFHLERDRDLVHYGLAKKRILAGLSPPGARSVQFFVAEEGASAVAYVVVSVHGDEWMIESCGDRDPVGARMGAILQVLIAREPREQRPTIRGWLPTTLRPPQIAVAEERSTADVMMVRPLTDRARGLTAVSSRDVLFWRADLF